MNAEGTVNVVPGEDTNDKQVLSIPVNRIIFFARGAINTNEASCFAFTVASQEQDQTTGAVVFQVVYVAYLPLNTSSVCKRKFNLQKTAKMHHTRYI